MLRPIEDCGIRRCACGGARAIITNGKGCDASSRTASLPPYPERLRRIIIYPLLAGPLLREDGESMLDPVTKAKIKVIKGTQKRRALSVGLCAYDDPASDSVHAVRGIQILPRICPTKASGDARRRPSLDAYPTSGADVRRGRSRRAPYRRPPETLRHAGFLKSGGRPGVPG